MSRFGVQTFVFACTLGTTSMALAQQATSNEIITVTTRAGDTCPAIAERVYGSASRIDVIHTYNTMGAMPHRFNAGTVLRLPRVAPPPRPVADAEVGTVRNDVRAYTPGEHPARTREPINRGQRVGTLANSTADVVMGNERAVHLEEHTLVVVLGRYNFQTQQRETAQDTRLERGNLLASLSALSGRPAPQPIVVTTPTATVSVTPGETLVGVDATRATQVSVYQGSAQVTARGRTVNVTEGNATTAAVGQRPTPPHPLPPRPRFSKGLGGLQFVPQDAESITLAAEYEVESRSSVVTKWRVQLARDARFREIISDEKVAASVNRFELRNAAPGDYYLRVRSIDSERFESRASEVEHVHVSAPRFDRGAPGRLASVTVNNELFCGLDGEALTPVQGPLVLAPLRAHSLRCALDTEGRKASTIEIAASEAGPVLVQTRLGEPNWSLESSSRLLVARVTDAIGRPLAVPELRARLTGDGTLDAPVASQESGTFVSKLQWNGNSASAMKVEFALQDTPLTTLEIAPVTAPADVQSSLSTRTTQQNPNAAPPFVARGELGVGLGLLASFTPLGVGFSSRIVGHYHAKTPWFDVLLGGAFEYNRWSCDGGAPTQQACNTLGVYQFRADAFSVGVSVGLTRRFGSVVAPYLVVEPQLVLSRTEWLPAFPIGTVPSVQPTFGIRSTLGVQFEIGRHAPFLEVGYRFSSLPAESLTSVSGGGLAATVGYKVLW